MTKELKGLEEGPKAENTHQFTQNDSKKYQIIKSQAMMEYMDPGSRNSPLFPTD